MSQCPCAISTANDMMPTAAQSQKPLCPSASTSHAPSPGPENAPKQVILLFDRLRQSQISHAGFIEGDL
jgi:hypothetical protein